MKYGSLALLTLAAALFSPELRAADKPGTDEASMRRFVEALRIVEDNAADPADADQAFYQGAIPGLLRHLDHAIATSDTSDLRLLRAETNAANGNHDKAKHDYKTVLEREPGHFAANVNLAGILNNNGQAEEAELLARRALALAPDAAPAWHNLTYGRLLRDRPGTVLLRARIAATLEATSPI